MAATLTFLIGLYSKFFSTADLDGDGKVDPNSDWIEGASIYFACAFIALFAAFFDLMKEKQYLKLHDEIKNESVSVVRG